MRYLTFILITLGVAIVGSCSYLASGLAGIEGTLTAVTEHLSGTPTEVVYSKKKNMKTLNYSKIVNGVTYSMEAEWDCTPEGLARITAAWQMLCDSIPDESAAAPGASSSAQAEDE